jgi:murein L,D-transpeptidase YafK
MKQRFRMRWRVSLVVFLVVLLAGISASAVAWPYVGRSVLAAMHPGATDRASAAATRVRPALQRELDRHRMAWGAPIHLRLFKEEAQLEVWVRDTPRYRLLKAYPICTFSGTLGPKEKQGDGQAPEGFYRVAAGQLNPYSSYHLSFNLGYPNAYDRAYGRTGSLLMVHGNCVSIGCYAMGDAAIEEIYTLVAAALAAGQNAVPVHIFPFRMDRDYDPRLADPQWSTFWKNLREGYLHFQEKGQPPAVNVRRKRYVFDDA